MLGEVGAAVGDEAVQNGLAVQDPEVGVVTPAGGVVAVGDDAALDVIGEVGRIDLAPLDIGDGAAENELNSVGVFVLQDELAGVRGDGGSSVRIRHEAAEACFDGALKADAEEIADQVGGNGDGLGEVDGAIVRVDREQLRDFQDDRAVTGADGLDRIAGTVVEDRVGSIELGNFGEVDFAVARGCGLGHKINSY